MGASRVTRPTLSASRGRAQSPRNLPSHFPPRHDSWSGEGGDHRLLEELHARAVVGRVGEVVDAVAQPQLLALAQHVDDLVGRARETLLRGAAVLPGDLGRLRVADGCREPRLERVDLAVDLGARLGDDRVEVRGARDRVEVGAELLAVPPQDLALARELLGAAVEVGVPRVLRCDLQRHLLAAARDPERDAALLQGLRLHDRPVDLPELAVEGGLPRGPGLVHDLDTLAQRTQPGRRIREAVAVGAELVLVPTGADAHLEASARDEVDRRSDL